MYRDPSWHHPQQHDGPEYRNRGWEKHAALEPYVPIPPPPSERSSVDRGSVDRVAVPRPFY